MICCTIPGLSFRSQSSASHHPLSVFPASCISPNTPSAVSARNSPFWSTPSASACPSPPPYTRWTPDFSPPWFYLNCIPWQSWPVYPRRGLSFRQKTPRTTRTWFFLRVLAGSGCWVLIEYRLLCFISLLYCQNCEMSTRTVALKKMTDVTYWHTT